MPYKYNPFTNNLDVVEDLSGLGTVTNFSFTDANGFDGTVTNPTTTPDLTLNTTVGNTQVMFSTNGALTGDADMTYTSATNTLNIAVLNADGTLKQTIKSSSVAADAVYLEATNGGLQLVTAGSADLLLWASLGSVTILGTEAVTDSIALTSNSGGIQITGALGIRLSGALRLGQSNVSTTPVTLDAGNGFITVDSTAGNITLNLPAGENGLTYTVYHRAGANSVIIDANGTEVIRLGNTVTSAGGTATSATVGDSITFTFNSTSLFWQVTSSIGVWTLA